MTVREALEPLLRCRLGRAVSIAALDRRPSAYRTSFALDELDVVLDDGSRLELVVKRLGPDALSPSARRAKPEFLLDPMREMEVYEAVLGPNGAWAPACYGALVDPGTGRLGLVLERVSGVELYQVGQLDTWCETARCLASMHAALHERAARSKPSSLLRYDASHYRRFAARALEFGSPPAPVESLLRRYDTVVERLLELPIAFSHGEFYASNVLVERRRDGLRVAPVDWEMAAWAPRLLDLAALTSGSWTADDRRSMARAYRGALEPDSGLPGDESRFLEALELCRLQLAVQWLGWSPDWTPPAENAHDWSAEAERIVLSLEL